MAHVCGLHTVIVFGHGASFSFGDKFSYFSFTVGEKDESFIAYQERGFQSRLDPSPQRGGCQLWRQAELALLLDD